MTDGAAVARSVLTAGVRAPRRRADRRVDHRRTGLRRRARGRHGLDGHARREGGPGADVIVVADGPGNLGTDTTWGVSALGSGNALNAVAALGGRPIPSPADQLRRRACATSGRLASFAHDPARRLPRADGRARAGARGRGPARTDLGRAARREARGAASARGGRRPARRWTSSPTAASSPARWAEASTTTRRSSSPRARPGVLAGRVAAGNRRWRAGGDA